MSNSQQIHPQNIADLKKRRVELMSELGKVNAAIYEIQAMPAAQQQELSRQYHAEVESRMAKVMNYVRENHVTAVSQIINL